MLLLGETPHHHLHDESFGSTVRSAPVKDLSCAASAKVFNSSANVFKETLLVSGHRRPARLPSSSHPPQGRLSWLVTVRKAPNCSPWSWPCCPDLLRLPKPASLPHGTLGTPGSAPPRYLLQPRFRTSPSAPLWR